MQKSGYFLGFLVNVDSTIIKVKLDHGFKIEAVQRDYAIELRSSLEQCSKSDAFRQMLLEEYAENEDVYIIRKSFRYDEMTGLSALSFARQYIQDYLENILKLMVLFKEGGIYMPRYYIRLDPGDSPNGLGGVNAPVYSLQKFTINESEIAPLESFLRKTILPFNKPFIQLAFDALIESYTFRNRDRALSFVLLVTGLEILFSDNLNIRGKDQIIAKRVSNIIGGSVEDKRKIRNEIVKLYKKMSNIIHNGDFNAADANKGEG